MYITSRALLPSLVPIIASEDPKHYSQLAGSESCTKQRKRTRTPPVENSSNYSID